MERTTARSFFQIPLLKLKLPTSSQKGFSLVELLIVMAIMTILLTIGTFRYLGVQQKSRDARRKSDLEQVRAALETYRAQNGYYPPSTSGNWMNLSGVSGLVPDYISILPADPRPLSLYYYKYKSINLVGANYYGYCLASILESTTTQTNLCSEALPTIAPQNYLWGVRQP